MASGFAPGNAGDRQLACGARLSREHVPSYLAEERLATIGLNSESAIVGQRPKRLPSIENKLHRNPKMKLERMQDIAGLRAVVPRLSHLRDIRRLYEQENR